jgi:hypothetical protein
MKSLVTIVISLILQQFLYSQTLKVTKKDKSAIDFQITGIDSITFTVEPQVMSSELPDSNFTKTLSPENNDDQTPVDFEKVSDGINAYGDSSQGDKVKRKK